MSKFLLVLFLSLFILCIGAFILSSIGSQRSPSPPSNKTVCANGSLVKKNSNCDSTTLPFYETLNANEILENVSFRPMFIPYLLVQADYCFTPMKDFFLRRTSCLHSKTNITPKIPYNYFLRKNGNDSNVTIIGSVNESLAYEIADLHMYVSYRTSDPQSNALLSLWQVEQKSIVDLDNSFLVSMRILQKICGLDLDSSVCWNDTLEGIYLINKNTGRIAQASQ